MLTKADTSSHSSISTLKLMTAKVPTTPILNTTLLLKVFLPTVHAKPTLIL